MKKLILGTALSFALTSININAATNIEVDEYQRVSDLANTAIRNKNYDKAFAYLTEASKLGNKVSQFSLALLYIQGYGTEQDYTQAYLWLNVAAEANETKWRNLKDKIHNALTAEQKNALTPLVTTYIDKYGAKAQEVSCYRKAAAGSNMKMMTCTKHLDEHYRQF